MSLNSYEHPPEMAMSFKEYLPPTKVLLKSCCLKPSVTKWIKWLIEEIKKKKNTVLFCMKQLFNS